LPGRSGPWQSPPLHRREPLYLNVGMGMPSRTFASWRTLVLCGRLEGTTSRAVHPARIPSHFDGTLKTLTFSRVAAVSEAEYTGSR
jgi:hypothetical protein